jgi:branched-subunit amino acid ABC-type transport system permease component
MSRRAVMLAADTVRAVAIGVLAVLSLTGRIQVWEIAGLAMVYGAGTAFFTPAFEALVPDILPGTRIPLGPGASVGVKDLIVIAIAVVLVIGLNLFIDRTRLGKAMRATAPSRMWRSPSR